MVLTAALASSSLAQPEPTADLRASNWMLSCASAAGSSALACEMSKTLTLAETGQVFVAVFVLPGNDPEGAAQILRLQLPHGVDVVAGVALEVDGSPVAAPLIRTSGPNGLFASTDLTPDLLAALQAGDEMRILFEALSGQKLSVPVPLSGFGAVYDRTRVE